jgi:DNA-binding NarL/FixJ family response regulator
MQPQSRKKRVLIADTTQETRRNTRVMLSSIKGVEVVAIALDGTQTIEMARQHKPDIILLDMNITRSQGMAAYKQVMQENPHIVCILVAPVDNTEIFEVARSVGIQDHLIKPFSAYELDQLMQHVIQRLNSEQSVTARVEHEKHVMQIKQLADEYVRTKRTDEEAVKVFEEAIQLPESELVWMQTLAMIYVVRKRWGKLKILAEKLEQRTK